MTSLARGGQARVTLTLARYVRKTRRYGGSWPLQIGNALFWRREAFAYVCHEEVLPAAVLAISPLHLPCISPVSPCISGAPRRRARRRV